MNDLANRPRRAPDPRRFDADATRPPRTAQDNDVPSRAHRLRLNRRQATGTHCHRSAPPHNAEPTNPIDRHPGADLPCQVYDPDLWFADSPADLELAKALCAHCPALLVCLTGAIDRHEPLGVWGGEIFHDGRIVTFKRPRGRPRRYSTAPEQFPTLPDTA